MHNKLLVADTQMAIFGGRNVGDRYFGLNHKYNFHDLDVVAAGNAAVAASQIFDHFWNSERVSPTAAFVDDPSWEKIEAVKARTLDDLRHAADLSSLPVERRDWSDELATPVDTMSAGTATAEYDRLIPDSAALSQHGVARLAEIVDTAPVKARFPGLHTEAAVIDREIVYVGSLNLDPRSFRLNSEMGMVVASPGLAEAIAAIAERDMAPENSWRVELDEDGKLFWESTAGTLTRQPAQSWWQRVQAFFFRIAPEGQR